MIDIPHAIVNINDIPGSRALHKKYANASPKLIQCRSDILKYAIKEKMPILFPNVNYIMLDHSHSVFGLFFSDNGKAPEVLYTYEAKIFKLRRLCRKVWYTLRNLQYHGLERKWYIRRYAAQVEEYKKLKAQLKFISDITATHPEYAWFNSTFSEWMFVQHLLKKIYTKKSLFFTEEQKHADKLLEERFTNKARKAKAQGEAAYFAFLDGVHSNVTIPARVLRVIMSNIKDERK